MANIWDNAQTAAKRPETPQERHNRHERERYHGDEQVRLKRQEYNRRYRLKHPYKTKKQKWLDDACAWLEDHLPYGVSAFCDDNIIKGKTTQEVVLDFRKAMMKE